MMGGLGRRFARWAIFLVALALPVHAAAQSEPPTVPGELNLPTLLSADEIIYDENSEVITAKGNVEISQNDRMLIADTVSYAIETGTVTAEGGITLLEPSGDVVFAEYVELTDDMREGFIRDIRVLLVDESRLAAASGERREGRYMIFRKGIFSPCKLCRDDPERAPVWQIKAAEVVHDQEDKTIQYRDAWMEMFGVPIAYTPYLEHPDPTVKRKSGILAPAVGNSDTLGFTFSLPYFWAIDDTKDLTFRPLITTEQSVVLGGEYRQLFASGDLTIEGSGTIADQEEDNVTKKNQLRGHIDAEGRFNLDETWRTGFDLERSTDATYLRLYNFGAPRTLTSNAHIEGFRGRNYAAVNAFAFQGLRSDDDNDEAPILAPLMEYSLQSEPGVAGGIYSLDANLLGLHRIEGRDSRRLSLKGRYEIPFTAPAGDVYSLVAQVRADGYWTHGVDPGNDAVNPVDGGGSDFAGRIFPQLALKWRYPWIQHNETWNQTIEPIAQIVLAPEGSNPNEIPNEDSLGLEFDDTNIFNLNRFAGADRVDSGSRVDYGLNWRAETDSFGVFNAFLGQSYRFSRPDADLFDEGSGLDTKLSDIVGRIQAKPIPEIDLSYRFRVSKDNLNARRNELATTVGPSALRLNLDYIFVESDSDSTGFDDREELRVAARSQFTENWAAFVSHRRDLFDDRALSTKFGLTYSDECFLITGTLSRTFFRDDDLEPEDTILVRAVFKHLGEVSSQ